LKPLILAISLAVAFLTGTPAPARAEGAPQKTLVFVADGSGDQTYLSDSLCGLVSQRCLPLCVERVAWSRTGVGALDLHDRAGQKAAAERLAGRVLAARACDPAARICLVGHSAGAHVVLAAAERLPCGSVQRIVLLGAAVSRRYDLRPALDASCEGLDSFYSKCDKTLLTLEAVCLTADGQKALTGGRVGFAPREQDDPRYCKLRQHPYESWMKDLGHNGGHYGWTRCPFLLNCVVPLLLPGCGG
jgi:pimeloyl-ACP methyl ester carboxylesterase